MCISMHLPSRLEWQQRGLNWNTPFFLDNLIGYHRWRDILIKVLSWFCLERDRGMPSTHVTEIREQSNIASVRKTEIIFKVSAGAALRNRWSPDLPCLSVLLLMTLPWVGSRVLAPGKSPFCVDGANLVLQVSYFVIIVQSPSCVRLFEIPLTAASQGSLSLTIFRSWPKFKSIASVMPSSHLTLWCPLLPLPSSLNLYPNQWLCQWVNYLHQFSSVQSLSHVRLFVIPWTAARQASLSITNSRSLPKLMSIESVMPSNYLILCHPLLLLPSIFPRIRVFSNESVLCIRCLNFWSFSFSISPSNEYSGMISFRMDWFYLFEVQETLKSLLQHHSFKASILQWSAFFMVQLSHQMTKTLELQLQHHSF